MLVITTSRQHLLVTCHAINKDKEIKSIRVRKKKGRNGGKKETIYNVIIKVGKDIWEFINIFSQVYNLKITSIQEQQTF